MKKGERRPRQWNTAPVEGRMSVGCIRAQLAAIERGLRTKNLSNPDRLEYLRHAERLDKELKAVTRAKLQAQLQELETPES